MGDAVHVQRAVKAARAAAPRVGEQWKVRDVQEIRPGNDTPRGRIIARDTGSIDMQVDLAAGVIVRIVAQLAAEAGERAVGRQQAELVGPEIDLAGGRTEVQLSRFSR